MNSPTRISVRRLVTALALVAAASAPVHAGQWRGGPCMQDERPSCCKQRCDMPKYDACDNMNSRKQGYMHPNMQSRMEPRMHQLMPQAARGLTLGVLVSDLSNARLDAAGLSHGIEVERVLSDSAAAAAGFRSGDVITEFAGSPVYSGDRLRWLVRKAEPGKPLDVKVMREQQPVQLSVSLTAPEAKPKCEEKAAPVGTGT
jgi:membrane-associated protease RseP (regulator of RpoE activity)